MAIMQLTFSPADASNEEMQLALVLFHHLRNRYGKKTLTTPSGSILIGSHATGTNRVRIIKIGARRPRIWIAHNPVIPIKPPREFVESVTGNYYVTNVYDTPPTHFGVVSGLPSPEKETWCPAGSSVKKLFINDHELKDLAIPNSSPRSWMMYSSRPNKDTSKWTIGVINGGAYSKQLASWDVDLASLPTSRTSPTTTITPSSRTTVVGYNGITRSGPSINSSRIPIAYVECDPDPTGMKARVIENTIGSGEVGIQYWVHNRFDAVISCTNFNPYPGPYEDVVGTIPAGLYSNSFWSDIVALCKTMFSILEPTPDPAPDGWRPQCASSGCFAEFELGWTSAERYRNTTTIKYTGNSTQPWPTVHSGSNTGSHNAVQFDAYTEEDTSGTDTSTDKSTFPYGSGQGGAIAGWQGGLMPDIVEPTTQSMDAWVTDRTENYANAQFDYWESQDDWPHHYAETVTPVNQQEFDGWPSHSRVPPYEEPSIGWDARGEVTKNTVISVFSKRDAVYEMRYSIKSTINGGIIHTRWTLAKNGASLFTRTITSAAPSIINIHYNYVIPSLDDTVAGLVFSEVRDPPPIGNEERGFVVKMYVVPDSGVTSDTNDLQNHPLPAIAEGVELTDEEKELISAGNKGAYNLGNEWNMGGIQPIDLRTTQQFMLPKGCLDIQYSSILEAPVFADTNENYRGELGLIYWQGCVFNLKSGKLWHLESRRIITYGGSQANPLLFSSFDPAFVLPDMPPVGTTDEDIAAQDAFAKEVNDAITTYGDLRTKTLKFDVADDSSAFAASHCDPSVIDNETPSPELVAGRYNGCVVPIPDVPSVA